MFLFRLSLLTLWVRKTWVVILILTLGLPFVMPYMAPVETVPKLMPPARAHAAWLLVWGVGILWGLSQAARLGDGNSRTGIGNYLRSRGQGSLKQMLSMWSALMIFLLPVVLIAVVICLLAAMPGDPEEKGLWVATNLQAAFLFLIAIGPLALLGISLSSRFGAMVGFVVPAALCLYGLYGVGHLAETIKMGGNPVLEWLYIVSPQYHLADLTPRLIFKMGQVEWGAFAGFLGYFVLLGGVLAGTSLLLFRTEPLRS